MIYYEVGSENPYLAFGAETFFLTEKQLDEEVFMFWRTKPTLMIGKYQNPYEEINMDYAKEHGIMLVRRMSGGGTIYTDMGGWQYTFIVKDKKKGISFSEFISPVIDALHSVGVEDAGFNGRNDLVINCRKFSGNAQYKHGDYTLHHGSLLFDTNIEEMVLSTNVDPEKIISKSIKSVRDRVTNISEHLKTKMTGEEFKELMIKAIMKTDDVEAHSYIASEDEKKRIKELANEKYKSAEAFYEKTPKYSFQNSKRFDGGKIEFSIQILQGRIEDINVSGDFFGTLEQEDLKKTLIGVRYEKESIKNALKNLEGKVYRITTDEMLTVILP